MTERARNVALAVAAVLVLSFAGYVLVHSPTPAGYVSTLQPAPTAGPPMPASGPAPSASPTAPTPAGSPVLRDEFNRANSNLLGTAPTGQQWVQNGSGGMQLAGGRMVTAGDGRGYANVALAATPSALQVTGSFVGASDMPEGVTMFSSTDSGAALQNVVDLEVRPSRYVLEVRQAGGAFESIATGSLSLATDGRPYTWSFGLKGGAVDLALPDGTSRTVTDPRISTVSGPSVTWEARSTGASVSRVDAVRAYGT